MRKNDIKKWSTDKTIRISFIIVWLSIQFYKKCVPASPGKRRQIVSGVQSKVSIRRPSLPSHSQRITSNQCASAERRSDARTAIRLDVRQPSRRPRLLPRFLGFSVHVHRRHFLQCSAPFCMILFRSYLILSFFFQDP